MRKGIHRKLFNLDFFPYLPDLIFARFTKGFEVIKKIKILKFKGD